MEYPQDTALFLSLLNGPAFSVKDGLVDSLNANAQYLNIQPGTPIADLISIGIEEYESMEQGRLFLTLLLEDVPFGASVSRMRDWDLFLLEPAEQRTELAALELASRELRGPMSDLKMLTDLLMPKLDEQYHRLYDNYRNYAGCYGRCLLLLRYPSPEKAGKGNRCYEKRSSSRR